MAGSDPFFEDEREAKILREEYSRGFEDGKRAETKKSEGPYQIKVMVLEILFRNLKAQIKEEPDKAIIEIDKMLAGLKKHSNG